MLTSDASEELLGFQTKIENLTLKGLAYISDLTRTYKKGEKI